MWVYQETETNAAALVPTLPEDTAGESLAEKEAMTPASKPLAELPPQKAPRRKPFQASRDCILLAAAYLFGTLMAGVLQALCDAEEMETLAYYLDCWRGVFAASSAAQAVGLFGAELAVVLGAAAVFLLLGLSAVGPLPIFLFAMLYGTGSGLLSAQLLNSLGAKQLVLFLLTRRVRSVCSVLRLCRSAAASTPSLSAEGIREAIRQEHGSWWGNSPYWRSVSARSAVRPPALCVLQRPDKRPAFLRPWAGCGMIKKMIFMK